MVNFISSIFQTSTSKTLGSSRVNLLWRGMMIFVDNENTTDASVNLAIEEYLLQHLDTEEDILLFYINGPSIIIGRNQNTIEEINREYVDAHGIQVVRRLSGGGAVYHDLGNLNFSFIMRDGQEDISNFRKFTAPVIRALNRMNVPAELGGRNDIVVEGRKISGNASYRTKRGLVSHGTLLFDTDLGVLSQALNVKPGKIESKGIKSVRSRVANICEFLQEEMDIAAFRLRILHSIFEGADPIPQYRLTRADWDAIYTLSAERYKTWEWNYGHSPEFNVQKVRRFTSGEIDARINVNDGLIQSIRFYGDFFGKESVSEVEDALKGVRYERKSLENAIRSLDLGKYFGGVEVEEFIEFLC